MAAAGLITLLLLTPLHGGLAAGTGTLVLKTATGDHNFNIEVVITDQERALGLMFRRSLPENAGKKVGANPHTITIEFGKVKSHHVGQMAPQIDKDNPNASADSRIAGIYQEVSALLKSKKGDEK